MIICQNRCMSPGPFYSKNKKIPPEPSTLHNYNPTMNLGIRLVHFVKAIPPTYLMFPAIPWTLPIRDLLIPWSIPCNYGAHMFPWPKSKAPCDNCARPWTTCIKTCCNKCNNNNKIGLPRGFRNCCALSNPDIPSLSRMWDGQPVGKIMWTAIIGVEYCPRGGVMRKLGKPTVGRISLNRNPWRLRNKLGIPIGTMSDCKNKIRTTRRPPIFVPNTKRLPINVPMTCTKPLIWKCFMKRAIRKKGQWMLPVSSMLSRARMLCSTLRIPLQQLRTMDEPTIVERVE
mmetsp:Transcript_20747/g.43415  ORF Transcript_20747/g.43415 Transcript_20747/m.43415 type:complete len:285 (-) Transcript_20747:91-945(-)